MKAILIAAIAYSLLSPDGKVAVTVNSGERTSYSVSYSGTELISKSPVSMVLDDGTVLGTGKAKAAKSSVDEVIASPFYRKAQIRDSYNELTLNFKAGSVTFRAYDNGVAWRFSTKKTKATAVLSEQASFNFAGDFTSRAAYCHKYVDSLESQFMDDFENTYTVAPLSEWNRERMSTTPLMVEGPDGIKMVIAESDVIKYPGMFLYAGDAKNALEGRLAGYPKVETQGGHNKLQMIVEEREDYIATLDGQARTFPWRVVCISAEDRQMVDNDLVYQLASRPLEDSDFSWVKPGKVAWDWLNNWNIRGVDFLPGINTQTYKYYIDFASRHGIEYVILDEGWAVKYECDLTKVIPEIDLQEIIDYGKSKNVGIILWAGYYAFARDIEGTCRLYSEMGAKGFKVDFMDRDDQKVETFLYEVAETAAKYQMLIDFHGIHKPTGLQRRFPNIVNQEGVFGLEQMRRKSLPEYDQVTYDVTIPFIRFVAGFADYTQGAMRNASKKNHRPVLTEVMSQGTRCRQLADYVVFDSPLNMLCDSPTTYEMETDCLEFIASVPTVWDETRVLDGKVGEYVVVARRKGETWYVGALTDWNERDLEIDLASLAGDGARVDAYIDGMAAHKFACDFRRLQSEVNGKYRVHLAPGGGFAAVITK